MDIYMDVIDTTEEEREVLLRDIRYRVAHGHAVTLRDLDYLAQYDRDCYTRTYNQLGLDGADMLRKQATQQEMAAPTPRIQHVPNPLQATIDELISSIRMDEQRFQPDLVDGVSASQVMELMQEPAIRETEENARYQYFSGYEPQSLLNAKA